MKTATVRQLRIQYTEVLGWVASGEEVAQLVAETSRLSATHTVMGGHRSFDLLHVAVATHLGAGVFLSFDTNQAGLAMRVGLKIAP